MISIGKFAYKEDTNHLFLNKLDKMDSSPFKKSQEYSIYLATSPT